MSTKLKPAQEVSKEVEPKSAARPAKTTMPSRSRWWLRRTDQLVLAGLTGASLVLLALYWLDMSGWGREPIEIDRLPQHELDFRVDVNEADWVEWAQLPGLGEILAKRVVEDREQNGPFQKPDDLLRVRGIGPKKLEAIRPYLEVPVQADESGNGARSGSSK